VRMRGRKEDADYRKTSEESPREETSSPRQLKPRICALNEIPEYQKGNIYIWTGYRLNFTFRDTLLSLFAMHNETLNIWTHLLGYFLFLWLTIYSLCTWLYEATITDKIMFLAWGFAAQFQNLASTFFHWFGCVNTRFWKLGCKLDYMAISVLVIGSMWPIFNYVFYCHPYWKFVYTGVMSALGVGSIFFAWHPYFQTPNFHMLRALSFIGMALIPILAGPHVLMHISFEELYPAGWRLLMMGACYIGGAFIYASHVPERNMPGRFDHGLNSHVIWHCLTIAAALWHYYALQTFHEMVTLYRGTCEGAYAF